MEEKYDNDRKPFVRYGIRRKDMGQVKFRHTCSANFVNVKAKSRLRSLQRCKSDKQLYYENIHIVLLDTPSCLVLITAGISESDPICIYSVEVHLM